MSCEMIMQYEGLIYNMSKKFYGVPKEDLVQAGFLGLLKAQKNYNPQTGVKFTSYASEYIHGEMYEVASRGRIVHLNKDNMRVYKRVKRTQELLEQKFGRSVSIKETANYLGINETLLTDILNSLNVVLSIEQDEINIPKTDKLDEMILLKESLQKLSAVEKNVIETRYMKDFSQMETAEVLGLSQVSVSRIESKAKEKIKKFIAS